VVPLAQEIQKLRKMLEMPRRAFSEGELTGADAVSSRTDERDTLLALLNKRKNLDPLVADIQKLRARMDCPERRFGDDELAAPDALACLTEERDELKQVLPLHDEIQSLHKKLELPARAFHEEELCGGDAVSDRTQERDALLARLSRMKELDPLLRQIQRSRQQLELRPREWSEEELMEPTAVEDRTVERDELKEVIPLESQIQRLRKQLDMPVREWREEDLAGPTAVPDRSQERDELLDRANTRKLVDPVVVEIQRLRKQMDLSAKAFTEEELFGPDAIHDTALMRDELKVMVPLHAEIKKLHKKLAVAPRAFAEEELTAESGQHAPLDERAKECNRLSAIPLLVDDIQQLRRELGMDRRKFDDEELTGPSNVEDRTKERDDLLSKLDRMRVLQPLIDELQRLRKQLDMGLRVFAEGELDADNADVMLKHEIDELKKHLNDRDAADALADEIQELRQALEMPKRVFEEEELDARDAVPKLTVERDDLRQELERRRAVGDLPEQINQLRETLGMPPKTFPHRVSINMVPELIEERDDLRDEALRRRQKADELVPKLEKLWKFLDIPKSDQPDLALAADAIPTLPWLDGAEKELGRLRDLLKDIMQDRVAEQQAILNKLWDQLHVPEDTRARFYRGIPNVYSEEGLMALTAEIERLHAMLLSSKKLIKLILKRAAFIQTMMEFEVVASDPRRLFKSSVQLNKEEQFRRTAYPTLLTLEHAIRTSLTDFEEQTNQPFQWEGEYYLVTLEREIEERPMDPNVFGVGQGQRGRQALENTKRESVKKSAANVSKTGEAGTKSRTTSAPTSRTATTTTKATASSPPTSRTVTAKPTLASKRGGSALPAGFKTASK
jgi:DNA-binding transcriptional regulator YiaG